MINIYLETGKKTTSEYVFIEALLKILDIDKSLFRIECVNGKDNLPNARNTFIANTENGGKNLIIFDADSLQNGGGFAKRKNELEETLKNIGVEADIFLFPNNRDDGDFETLISQLTQKEKHKRFFDCYEDYEKCLGTDYLFPNLKGKLFTYISAIPMSKTKRDRLGQGQWLFENNDYWNLESEALKPLMNYLEDFTKRLQK